MKDIHPVSKPCVYNCVTCKKEFIIDSAAKNTEVAIEVCSNCHTFFIGKQNATTTLRGRAEKLNNRFEAGLSNINKKPEKKKIQGKSEPRKSLNEL
ncbi:50S ribosomal protein L31 [Ureaplasma parvum]|uniref:50S ribosomal protein L31 n=1 Tax=Ureaplasma parvum TaxID=134821 RepID=UPI0026EEAD65|nr:50S ribosomal protein L31 [Ureaplasma parvum]